VIVTAPVGIRPATPPAGLEVHHLIHWTDGGPTNPKNLGCLCRRCHRDHHNGLFGITGDAEQPGGLTFTKPNGDVIEPCGKPNRPHHDLPPSAKPYQHPLGEAFNQHDLTFNPPPTDTPRVTPQPQRETAPKPWEQPRSTPAVDVYVPTDADRARYAQERQQVMNDSLRHEYESLRRDGYDITQLPSYNKLFATTTT
jgi:HNH endonuclease